MKRHRAMIVIVSALLLCQTPLAARADRVDGFIRGQMASRHVPGLSLAVVRNGKVVLARGYGLANVELAVPATPDTVYELASVTKQFTATAVMMLVEEGRIGLDDKLSRYLDGLPSTWGDITIRQLLSHTSGIKSYTSVPDFFKTERKDYAKEEILKLVADAPLDFTPGAKWSYSNTGYFLLGMLIEKVTGKSYGAFLKERIFQPLGMTRTRVNDLTEIITNRASGYTWDGESLRNGDYVSPTQPFAAGALVSTVSDMAKWDAALYTDRLLKRSSLAQMWTPVKLNDGTASSYGFGWQIGEYRTRKRISHGGGIPGFSTDISRFVDDHLTVIALANSDSVDAGSVATGVAAFYIRALVAHAPKPIGDDDPKMTRRLRELMTAIAAGNPDPQWFTEQAKATLFPARLQEAKSILGSRGRLQSFELMAERTEGNRHVRDYRAAWKDLSLRCSFTLTVEGKIDAIGVTPE